LKVSTGNRGRATKYYGNDFDNNKWWEGGNYDSKATSTGPNALPVNTEFVIDYLGNQIRVTDAQWCEYDKAWCDKKEAIWVDYVGFYTTPDFDASKVKKQEAKGGIKLVELKDIKKGLEVYSKDGESFGTIVDISGNPEKVTVLTGKGTKFICPPSKFLTYEFGLKSGGGVGGVGGKKLTSSDLKEGLPVVHPIFGEGKIIGFRPDKTIVKVDFKNKGEKDLRLDVAEMKF